MAFDIFCKWVVIPLAMLDITLITIGAFLSVWRDK